MCLLIVPPPLEKFYATNKHAISKLAMGKHAMNRLVIAKHYKLAPLMLIDNIYL